MAYARFLAANKTDSDMRRWTEAEYSKAVGVSDRTFRAWKQLPGFWGLVSELAPDTIHKFIPQIMQVQIKEALSGDLNSAKFLLNQADRLKGDKSTVDAGDNLVELVELMRNRKQVIDVEFTDTPAIQSGS